MNNNNIGRPNPQNGLLDLLAPGAMLRFTYNREGGRLRFDIEGTDCERRSPSSTLAERLQITLEMLQNDGLMFAPQSVAITTNSCVNGNWLVVQPRSRSFLFRTPRELGFGMTTPSRDESESIALPDLSLADQRRWLDFVAALLFKENDLLAVEIEFCARELSAAEGRAMQVVFENRIREHEVLFGRGASVSGVERFLGLWLRNKRGWSVRCRVLITQQAPVPSALIETIASEVFGTPLESEFDPIPSPVNFTSSYPQGWDFAPLLPPRHYFDALCARKILNNQLPPLPETGILMGQVEGKALRMPHEMRDRHCFIVGATGTGKSTLLFNLIQQDLNNGEAVILLDPHGDLFEQVRNAVPKKRAGDVTILNPFSDALPPAINVLDIEPGPRQSQAARFVIGEIIQLFGELWDMRNCGGPMFDTYFRNAILLLTEQGSRKFIKPTLLHFQRVISDREFRNSLVEVCRDAEVKFFWKSIAEKVEGDAKLANIAPYITSKLDVLTQSAFVRQIIGQADDTLKIGQRMDRGEIVLINLSKGALGPMESRLLGTLLLSQIFSAGLNRGAVAQNERRPVNIYVDEFQNFTSTNMVSMLSESRKFGLRLVLANQTLGQLASERRVDLTDAILGNAGHMAFFRLGVLDAEKLKSFTKPFSPEDMQTLPNYHAFVRLLTTEGPLKPVVMNTTISTVPPSPKPRKPRVNTICPSPNRQSHRAGHCSSNNQGSIDLAQTA